jgi:hypothetical protein
VSEALVVASLALFAALVAAFVFVLRRTARVVAETREDETFRRDAAALTDRASAALSGGGEQIDRVRRRQDSPAALDEVLPGLLETLAGFQVEAEALAPPSNLATLRGRIAEEIDRAARAVETVQHGCALLAGSSGRALVMEGETSVKRGYLNLLHAREALVALGADLRTGRLGPQRWYSDRPRAG